ncbi:hypothetical protein [Streptomyces sp. NPDC057557]|uniref:hypothetical protein n=1 Tax=Streptomyces sp. NPDC057557 TaxID=3346167 RepID=UPI0036D06CAF
MSFAAPADFVSARLPASIGPLQRTGENSCRLRAVLSDSLEWVALRLALVDCEFTAHEPPQLVEYLSHLGDRLTRATAHRHVTARTTADPASTERTEGRPPSDPQKE